MKLAALFEAKKPLEITPENVLANINGNWTDTLMAMGYNLDKIKRDVERKKIQPILDQLVKDKKITYSTYPAEDNVYRLVK